MRLTRGNNWPHRVLIPISIAGGPDWPTHVQIDGPIPAELSLVWNGAVQERDQLSVRENRGLARAIFDGETRRRASQLRQHGAIQVAGGVLRMTFPPKTTQDILAVALSDLLRFAERLVRPGDVLQRLAENARHDWDPECRLESLLTLVEEYPGHPTTLETLRAAAADTHDEIRLQAGIALGEEGHEALLGVASREWPSDSCSARAVAALGAHLSRERACAILHQALDTQRVETALSCLQALGRMGGTEVVKPLASALAVGKGTIAQFAARALGWTGQTAAEGPLVAALYREDARVAAARALAHVGTVEAVLPLMEAEARYPRDKELRLAASQAVIDIQSRLSGASRGQLSVAEGATGHLSLAEGEGGELSLMEDPVATLTDSARRDEDPEARLQSLLTLVREHPRHPATREALRVASKDESDEIRLRAAIARGEEGRSVLLEMASGGDLASGRSVDDQWSAGAIAALGKHLPRERAQAILEGALMARRPRTARECVRALSRMGGSEIIEPLSRALLTARGEVAAEAARALGATGLSSAEPPLLEALERGLPEQRTPVVEALGRVGSVEAVRALNEAVARRPNDADLRRAMRQAVAEIQSRLTGAAPGQLSLAESEGGRLSLAGPEAGRLSMPDNPRESREP